MQVGVVGCGVAGQAAAILLADAGHAVTVFERFAEPRPLGAGLLASARPDSRVLRVLGLADAAVAQGARVVGLEGRTRRGRSVLDLRYADLHPKALRTGHPAQRAVRPAARTAPAFAGCAGHRRGDRRSSRRGLGRRQAGATHGPFDLVVVADGAHSALRARLMPGARAPVYPWGCIWTTVPDSPGWARPACCASASTARP